MFLGSLWLEIWLLSTDPCYASMYMFVYIILIISRWDVDVCEIICIHPPDNAYNAMIF